MKKKISGILAAMLSVLPMLSALPAGAVYQSPDEIAFSLRGMETENCGYIADGNTVYVAPSAAKAGTRVHIGMYIEAEYADLVVLNAKLQSDSPNITFNEETYHNPTTYYTDEMVTYTTEAGVVFETRLKPYCLGIINSANVYLANSFGVSANFESEENSMNVMWMYGYSDRDAYTASFFGSRSDEYSFIELDLDIAAGTPSGTYSISFVTNAEENGKGETYVTSDDTANGVTDYNYMIPELKDLQIVVTQSDYFVEDFPMALRYAEDEAPITAAEFIAEGTQLYAGSETGFAPRALDPSKLTVDTEGMTLQELEASEAYQNGELSGIYYDGQFLSSPMSSASVGCAVGSGLRGDANRDGMVDALDAACILEYAAAKGAGGSPTLYSSDSVTEERTAYFLADVTDGSKICGNGDGTALDATDAGCVLQYAAIGGTGEIPDWNVIVK